MTSPRLFSTGTVSVTNGLKRVVLTGAAVAEINFTDGDDLQVLGNGSRLAIDALLPELNAFDLLHDFDGETDAEASYTIYRNPGGWGSQRKLSADLSEAVRAKIDNVPFTAEQLAAADDAAAIAVAAKDAAVPAAAAATAERVLAEAAVAAIQAIDPDAVVGAATNGEAVAGVLLNKAMNPANNRYVLDVRYGSETAATVPVESGFAATAKLNSGRLVYGIDASGHMVIFKAQIPVNTRLDDGDTLADRIFSARLGTLFGSLPPESGLAFAVTNEQGRVLYSVPAVPASPGPATTRHNARYRVTTLPGDGGRQVASIRIADGQTVMLTETGDHSEPVIGDDDIVYFFDDGGLEYAVPAAGGPIRPLLPLNIIQPWGDSLMDGVGSSDVSTKSMPAQLAALTGFTVDNSGAVASQTSTQIAARQGGSPALLSVTDDEIPASGPVDITAASVLPITMYTRGAPQELAGTLAGVAGKLTRPAGFGNAGDGLTFTRTAAGDAVACPAGTPFIPDLAVSSAAAIQIIGAGRNNPVRDTVLADIAAMVAYLTPIQPRFVVLSILNSTTEVYGSGGYSTVLQINRALADRYPGFFFDCYRPASTDELAWLGVSPTGDDVTDAAADCMQTSLRASGDALHLNDDGYKLVAKRVGDWLTNKGWF